MRSNRTLFLIEVAMFAALALALDLIPFLKFKIWPQGGSVSFAMIPVFIAAFRWGLRGGLLTGFIWGMLQIPLGGSIFHPLQALIDYTLAFTVIGFAGVFAKHIQQAVADKRPKSYFSYIVVGVFLGSMLRFITHVGAGVFFFDAFMPDGWDNVWIYSLVYNASYIFPSFIVCTAGIFLLFRTQPKTLLNTAA